MTIEIYNMGLRFKQVAQQYPKNIALACENNEGLTYEALDKKSDAVAALLCALGVKAGSVVALFADKHPLTYATMIAALKIGSPYVVLDMNSPKARLDKILTQCQPSLIVTQEPKFLWNDTAICKFLELEAAQGDYASEAIAQVEPSNPAYLMFTSGSTGFPKGVTISHASMLNFCHWTRTTFAITPQDKLSGANALYFDNSVFDFTASLFNGACLLPQTQETVRQPKKLVDQLNGCTVWFSVPSLLIYLATMRALDKESWPHMRAIIFGGEGYPKTELQKLHNMYGRQSTLWNVYGPTECTCICSAYEITEADFTDMDNLAPLGRLAESFTGIVIDPETNAELEDGKIGELLLCGAQVALGYYNDSERTQISFLEHPAQTDSGQTCYRTGDLVYRDTVGYYHFSGRKDNQIKHMGYRIELEEIEAALAGFSEVSQAVVLYIKKTSYAGKLVGCVTVSDITNVPELKNYLREKLPSYMIPEEIHVMDVLPKNANGKVDRKALLAHME